MDIEKDALNFLIIGKKGSGKTHTGYSILASQCLSGNRSAYVYMCPQPQLLAKLPFKVQNIVSLNRLFHCRDSVVLIDEANIHFDVRNKQINDDLKQLLQLSRQNNTTFIFIVHNSYVFNRGLFGLLDVKIIKEVTEDHWTIEREHMRKLYAKVRVSGINNMYVDCDSFKGYAQTNKLDWYTEEFSTMYRRSNEPKTLFETLKQKLK